jgi:hypothetical protein
VVQGALMRQQERHLLGAAPVTSKGELLLTLTFAPPFDPVQGVLLQDPIQVTVLSEAGLRQLLEGAPLESVNLATAVPAVQIGGNWQIEWRIAGSEGYTIIVASRTDKAVYYNLAVKGGVLFDDAHQTAALKLAGQVDRQLAGQRWEKVANGLTMLLGTDIPAQAVRMVTVVGDPVRKEHFSGSMGRQYDRHYFALEPAEHGGEVALTVRHAVMPGLRSRFNFLVLTQDGVAQLLRGAKPEELSLATGTLVGIEDGDAVLQAYFRTPGNGPYTVVLYNNSQLEVDYKLDVEGGVLVDRYGQSWEAKPAVNREFVVKRARPGSLMQLKQPFGRLLSTQSLAALEGFKLMNRENGSGAALLEAMLTKPYEQQYFRLSPTDGDAPVTVTLEYAPQVAQSLQAPLHFWLLSDEALEQVLAGTQPAEVQGSVGAVVRFEPEEGLYRAVFTPVAQANYTVVVYNNGWSSIPYHLAVEGGVLTPMVVNEALAMQY